MVALDVGCQKKALKGSFVINTEILNCKRNIDLPTQQKIICRVKYYVACDFLELISEESPKRLTLLSHL